jgi:hypothetical protein
VRKTRAIFQPIFLSAVAVLKEPLGHNSPTPRK